MATIVELRGLVKAVIDSKSRGMERALAYAAFTASASPIMVLRLIDELEDFKAEVNRLREQAACCHNQGSDPQTRRCDICGYTPHEKGGAIRRGGFNRL